MQTRCCAATGRHIQTACADDPLHAGSPGVQPLRTPVASGAACCRGEAGETATERSHFALTGPPQLVSSQVDLAAGLHFGERLRLRHVVTHGHGRARVGVYPHPVPVPVHRRLRSCESLRDVTPRQPHLGIYPLTRVKPLCILDHAVFQRGLRVPVAVVVLAHQAHLEVLPFLGHVVRVATNLNLVIHLLQGSGGYFLLVVVPLLLADGCSGASGLVGPAHIWRFRSPTHIKPSRTQRGIPRSCALAS